jgi:hypothetical protein
LARATQIIDVQIAAGEGIGVVLTAKKDFTGALETFKNVLVLAKEQKNRTREIELLWRRAQTYYEMGNYVEAAFDAESAVGSVSLVFGLNISMNNSGFVRG